MIEVLYREHKRGQIGRLELDATLSYTNKYTNEVTSFPVEDGSNISDHIRNKPFELTLTGFISDTPIKIKEGLADLLVSGTRGSRVAASYVELKNIWESRDVVDVITGLEVHSDMALVSLSVPRSPRDGHSMRFSATFRKITKAVTELVTLPNPAEEVANLATAPANVGAQASSETKEKSAQSTSVLAGLFGG